MHEYKLQDLNTMSKDLAELRNVLAEERDDLLKFSKCISLWAQKEKQQLASLSSQLSLVEKEKSDLLQKLTETSSSKNSLTSRLEALEEERECILKERNTLESSLQSMKQTYDMQLSSLRKEVEDARKLAEEKEKSLSEIQNSNEQAMAAKELQAQKINELENELDNACRALSESLSKSKDQQKKIDRSVSVAEEEADSMAHESVDLGEQHHIGNGPPLIFAENTEIEFFGKTKRREIILDLSVRDFLLIFSLSLSHSLHIYIYIQTPTPHTLPHPPCFPSFFFLMSCFM